MGGGREEPDVGAKVVVTAAAGLAPTARDAWLDGHPPTDEVTVHAQAGCNHYPARLVAQDEGSFDHIGPNTTVAVVVDIRSAYSDSGNLDEHLARPGIQHRALLDDDSPRL